MFMVNPSGERVHVFLKRSIIREDGRVEKPCSHGIGHPIGHLKKWEEWMGVHGCDGCCLREGFNDYV